MYQGRPQIFRPLGLSENMLFLSYLELGDFSFFFLERISFMLELCLGLPTERKKSTNTHQDHARDREWAQENGRERERKETEEIQRDQEDDDTEVYVHPRGGKDVL